MADEVERAGVLSGKIRDRRMDMLGEQVERLTPAGIVEVQRAKPAWRRARSSFQSDREVRAMP